MAVAYKVGQAGTVIFFIFSTLFTIIVRIAVSRAMLLVERMAPSPKPSQDVLDAASGELAKEEEGVGLLALSVHVTLVPSRPVSACVPFCLAVGSTCENTATSIAAVSFPAIYRLLS